MTDADQLIEGEGGYDYLVRSISIVSLLYERGILTELIESGRITEEDVQIRYQQIMQRYPEFANLQKKPQKPQDSGTGEL